MQKKLVIGLFVLMALSMSPLSAYAEQVNPTQEVTKVLNEDEINQLMDEDIHFQQEYQKYLDMGCTLTEVKETIVYNVDSGRYVNSLGKTVESTYKQKPVKKTLYNNKVADTISGLNNYFQILLGSTTKYFWIPVTYFNISTDDLPLMFKNGRQEIVKDETYHVKSAYYKDGSNYYIGHQAKASYIAITTINIFTDSNKNPHHDSQSHEYDVKSKNFSNDTELIRIANYNHTQGNPWTEEFPSYPSSVYLN